MAADIEIKLYITTRPNKWISEMQQILETSYAVNQCCSEIEFLNCEVSYKMIVDGKEWKCPNA